jgi:hypothetical protein
VMINEPAGGLERLGSVALVGFAAPSPSTIQMASHREPAARDASSPPKTVWYTFGEYLRSGRAARRQGG